MSRFDVAIVAVAGFVATISVCATAPIGVPACNRYVAEYEACINSRIPEDKRSSNGKILDEKQKDWTVCVNTNPQLKSSLEQTCETTMIVTNVMLSPYGMRPDATEVEQAKVRDAEVRRVWELVKADSIRSIHFISAPGRGAVLTMEAADVAEATRHIDALPAVQAGLLEPEIIGLVPFHGYEVLFHA